jgi:hypothetical protein
MRHAERPGVQDDKATAQSQIAAHSLATVTGDGRCRIEAKVICDPVPDQGDLSPRHACGDQGAPFPFTVDHDPVCVAIEEIGKPPYGTIEERSSRGLPHRFERLGPQVSHFKYKRQPP